jgi:hypothetical protein
MQIDQLHPCQPALDASTSRLQNIEADQLVPPARTLHRNSVPVPNLPLTIAHTRQTTTAPVMHASPQVPAEHTLLPNSAPARADGPASQATLHPVVIISSVQTDRQAMSGLPPHTPRRRTPMAKHLKPILHTILAQVRRLMRRLLAPTHTKPLSLPDLSTMTTHAHRLAPTRLSNLRSTQSVHPPRHQQTASPEYVSTRSLASREPLRRTTSRKRIAS